MDNLNNLLKKIPYIFKDSLWRQKSKKYFQTGAVESVFYYDNIRLKIITMYPNSQEVSLHIEVESFKIKNSKIKYYDEIFLLKSTYKKDILYQINQDLLNLDNRIIKMLPYFFKAFNPDYFVKSGYHNYPKYYNKIENLSKSYNKNEKGHTEAKLFGIFSKCFLDNGFFYIDQKGNLNIYDEIQYVYPTNHNYYEACELIEQWKKSNYKREFLRFRPYFD